jgi:hypothetical protein
MVRWIRTATIKNSGKFQEAIGWAKEVAAYATKAYGMGNLEVFVDGFGVVGKIRWMSDLPDLATIDQVNAKLMTDQQYWKLIDRAAKAELFIDGSVHDLVMRKV